MLAYLERAGEGIRGLVTDAVTGAPLDAAISVEGNGFPSYTDPDVGDYHRVVLAGTYDLEVSAVGYSTAVLRDVAVAPGPVTRIDVALEPLDTDLLALEGCADNGAACDAFLLPGQAADLAVTVRNVGNNATQVQGDLVPVGWHAEVSRPAATYPDLAAGASAESDAPHHGVDVSPDVPPGHKIGFALDWTTAEGGGASEPFFVPADVETCVTAVPADLPRSVLDRQTAVSTASVLDELELSSVTVFVDVAHTYRGDLRIEIVAPDGSAVTLHDRSGGSADDVLGTYGVDLVPFETLSRLDGASSLGDWELRVGDGVPGNSGSLDDWSAGICGRPFEASPPEMRLRDLIVEPDGVLLTWWRYPGLDSYRVYRSTDPTSAASFVDVTAEDPDAADTAFKDTDASPALYWLVTGVGRGGEGPLGHFDQ